MIYIMYSVWACGALVWSTLLGSGCGLGFGARRERIEYLPVSEELLFEWMAEYQNLVIFDVHVHREIGGRPEVRPSCRIPVSIVDLPGLLRWLPPASRIVFLLSTGSDRTQSRGNDDSVATRYQDRLFLAQQVRSSQLNIWGRGNSKGRPLPWRRDAELVPNEIREGPKILLGVDVPLRNEH
jgi:hypothetical protein